MLSPSWREIRQCNGDSNSENFRTGSILQRTSLASGVTEQAWLPLAIAKLAFRDAVVHMKCPRRLQYRDALQVGQVQCDALTRRDETFQQGMTPYRLKDQENLLQRGPLHGFFVFPVRVYLACAVSVRKGVIYKLDTGDRVRVMEVANWFSEFARRPTKGKA